MRRVILSVLLLCGFAVCSRGSELDLRAAARDAMQASGFRAPIALEEITFLSQPQSFQAGDALAVQNARFDFTLRAWRFELRDKSWKTSPSFVAIVAIDDPNLAPRMLSSRVKTPPTVHAGDKRVLIAQLGTVRIQQPVVCLQSGRAGDTIRVRIAGTQFLRKANISESGELHP